MPMKLTWDDLLIEDAGMDHAALLEDWRWLLTGRFSVVVGTKFGDWFIERPDGRVEMLDTIEGAVRPVASSREEFQILINTPALREEWLLCELVSTLHEKGIVPGPGQCYAFRIPPVLGGEAVSDNVALMDIKVWMSLGGQMHKQVQALPPGASITGFKVVE